MVQSRSLPTRPASPRAAIYARVSTDMQTERFGLDLQLHERRRHAEQHGYEVVKEYLEGEGMRGVSGAKTARVQTSAILSDLQQTPGCFTVLVLYDTSRLARDDSGLFGRWYEEELRRVGVTVEYVLGGYGLDPEGQLLKRIKQDFDTYERQKTAVRDRAGQAARARQGLWNGGCPPLGYDVVDGRFVLNPEEADLVREIYRLYTEVGLSVEQIGKRFYALGIPGKWARLGTRHHARRPSMWYYTTIYRILINPAYIGRAVWGMKKSSRPWLPQEQVEFPSPRIVTDEVWEQVRQRLARNRMHGRRDKQHPYLVSGLIRCQTCGRCLSAVTAQNTPLSYYFCVRKARRWNPECANTSRYRVAEVDTVVWAAVLQGLENPAALEEALARHLQAETLPVALEEARLKRVQDEITAIERQADEILRLSATSALAQGRAEGLLRELDARHAALVHEQDALARRLRTPSQATQGWHETLAQYRRWLQGTTWQESQLELLPAASHGDREDLTDPLPPVQLRGLLFALQQRIVRDVVEHVRVDPEGVGTVQLQGGTTVLPIRVTGLSPKIKKRRATRAPSLVALAEDTGSYDTADE